MYREFKQLDLAALSQEVLSFWKEEKIFEKSISTRPKSNPFTFYEGPPSANGMPGIHHVMGRAIKDIFCRYKTLKGFQVNRKGGWDTHGLPIELAVEKKLGITKEDIGKKISVDAYNKACREEVMKYTDVWNDLTEKMGYWVDLENPYVTYQNNYIETLWWILKQLYDKDFLYKGYTVQPYSPAAGTGLSSHELNQPGTYKMLKDTSITAQFWLRKDQEHKLLSKLIENETEDTAFIAWTTTPWTLPSNGALAVGEKIMYVKVKTFNQYTFKPVSVILGKDLVAKLFKKDKELSLADFKNLSTWDGKGSAPFTVVDEFIGKDLIGLRYHQLLDYVTNEDLKKNAFRVIPADYVTTEDGTGVVHIASVFGADDFRVANESGIPAVMITDDKGNQLPLVDKQGKFVAEVLDFAGKYVKEEYYSDEERAVPNFKSTDVLLAIKLKEDNKAFDVKKYEHSYPHCWRTDKPVLYYPLDSWFIKTTAVKEKLVALNKTINWKPESTGTGRFGNWLENLVDWNLSRSRYWGTPLPIWRTADGLEEKCIGSITELNTEIDKSVQAGFMPQGFELKDMHRPYVDDVILTSAKGQKMMREADLIDVWFDSGAMPYAQWHYPFENQDAFEHAYPADFIAEGVDQTRGWFFTLHAIAVMLSEASEEIKAVNRKIGNPGVAFKNVVSNGLVLDKNGNKMSKRLGNAVDPFSTISTYSADATRWYMISNASPWDNLKFSLEGLDEVRRKFFGTLYNAYAFFALYANIDKFQIDKNTLTKVEDCSELDRWILSLLQHLVLEVDGSYNTYEPTKAARAIQNFVDEHLSNWYIRLSRRRFWKGEMTDDKKAAYETLYACLETVAQLMSPIAPFFSDWLYKNLSIGNKDAATSVHLTYWKEANTAWLDETLNERMEYAQEISSMVLSLRKKSGINVRQPLEKILIPSLNSEFEAKIARVTDYILSETNVKQIEFITDTHGIVKKKLKPNFKSLGKKVGKDMGLVKEAIENANQEDIFRLETEGFLTVVGAEDKQYAVELNTDVEVFAEDIPGWQVTNSGNLTVALDVTITPLLKEEGISRELVNRIQNIRKEMGFEVTDRIKVWLQNVNLVKSAVAKNKAYICAEILADDVVLEDNDAGENKITIDDVEIAITIKKV
ncbi:isoleucyl-tRNA synthetase [Pedobacter sp. UYP30]|uniref:isoleucine--tRNA ligase n=1 Tax=Pedobacter sp. UYP30 TaxID=1756400 RepID=UPI003399DF7D